MMAQLMTQLMQETLIEGPLVCERECLTNFGAVNKILTQMD
ncbi:hypothetical protein ACJIZ3_009068 [Penstemon smallii]|uniref:Uncharacterized protein n=1 Tax=Penstemon smallii TaxID=265156 RepID=A0ABD3TBH4_9LAMI